MSTNPGDFVIIDGANIKGANLIGKLDALVRPGRKFIIPEFVLNEMGGPESGGRQALQAWIDRQNALGNISNLADGFNFDIDNISASDAAKYGTDRGDAGIKKWLTEVAPTNQTYTVFTDDFNLGAFGKDLPHVKPMGGIASFMAHDNLLSDEARTKAASGEIAVVFSRSPACNHLSFLVLE